jgi:hypothetical protein
VILDGKEPIATRRCDLLQADAGIPCVPVLSLDTVLTKRIEGPEDEEESITDGGQKAEEGTSPSVAEVKKRGGPAT